MGFSYCNTVKVFCVEKLGGEIKEFIVQQGYKCVLLITGGASTKKYASIVESELKDIHYILFDGVVSNPLVEKIDEIVKSVKNENIDAIIAVGGGSVEDTAKAVSVMLCANEGKVEDYTVNGKYSVPGIKKVLPIITVPTLCGSGAEVSPAALIRIGNEKRVIFSPLLHPVATFINKAFLINTPLSVLRRSAFDAFVQALEGYISLSSNNISDSFSISALENFAFCLPMLKSGNINEDVIEKIAIASIFSSYVCSTSSVGAIHAISDPISGRFNVHHATALAMVIVPVLKKNFTKVSKKRIEKLKNIFGVANEEFVEFVKEMIEELELLNGINICTVDNDVIADMVKESYNPDMAGNPYEFSEKEISDILGVWYGVR